MLPTKYSTALIASLIPLAAACGLWIASFAAHERYVWSTGSTSHGIVNWNGQLQFRVINGSKMPTGYQQLKGLWNGDERGAWEEDWIVLGSVGPSFFRWYRGARPWVGSAPFPPRLYSYTYECYSITYWFVALLLALPAGWFGFRHWQRATQSRRKGFPIIAKASD